MALDDKRLVVEMVPDSDATRIEHVLRYQFACERIKNGMVLDVACGSGYGTYMLSKVNSYAIGVDVSQEAVTYAAGRYKGDNLTYKVMDATELDFPDAYFDAVVSLETIPSIREYRRFLREMHRVLKPEGTLVLSTPTRDTVPAGKEVHVWYHVQEFVVEDMLEFLCPLFSNIKIWQQKLGYYSRFYKKLRLILRYLSDGALRYAADILEKRSKDLSKVSVFFRIIIFEGKYKFSIFPYFDQRPKIRPTFLIFTCNKKELK